jgi:hypothetical protein
MKEAANRKTASNEVIIMPNHGDCRSFGGMLISKEDNMFDPSIRVGLTLFPMIGDTMSSIDVTIDHETVSSNSDIYRRSDDGYVVHMCFLFCLVNDADEEANFREMELNYISSADATTIVLNNVETWISPPDKREYTNEVALQASLCGNEEPIEQVGVVKVCIESTVSAISILCVQDFAFSISGGGDQDTSQVGFANGSPQPLIEFVDCSQ